MSKKIIAVIVAVVLVFVGIIIFAIGFGIADFDYSALDSERYEMKTYTLTENFDSIDVSSVECDINVIKTNEQTCRVVCPESDNIYYDVSVNDSTLTVERIDNRRWYDHIGIFINDEMDITLYLPEKEYQKIKLLSVSGDINLSNISAASVAASSTSGDIEIGRLSLDTIEVETVSGDIDLSGVLVSETFTLNTVSGDIELLECDSEKGMEFNSVSGDIEGTLSSSKIFTVETTSGSIRVPQSGGEGICKITTTSGDVNIKVK